MPSNNQNSPTFIEEGMENQHFGGRNQKKQDEQEGDEFNFNSSKLMESIKEQLNTANEILPAHKNYKDDRQKISFKLTEATFYRNQKQQNLKAFPQINLKRQHKRLFKNKEQFGSQISLEQEMGEFSFLMTDRKSLVYQRMKNEKLNYLSRNGKMKQKIGQIEPQNKYFCSLFINPKLPKHQSKEQPLWQYLSGIYLLDNPKAITDVLQFQSHFQSGNLFAALRDNGCTFPTYELFMQNDINTKGSTQWFYFKVASKSRIKVKFKIVNFYKPTSLYQLGMKILVSTDAMEWKRVGTAINYCKSGPNSKGYCLQFIYEFQQSGKNISFAYGYPYNYTQKLSPFVENILKLNYCKKNINRTVLCKSNMGNDIYLITITNNIFSMKKQKPIMYIIGRQHPGQTPSSYVVEGFVNFLLSNRIQAQCLREQFQFRIVPMVNVDGVISGNYRTNISGNDVNRQWMFPSKSLHPQIFHIKQQIVSNKRNTVFFLDIHAHSRKMNSFFYGSKQINQSNKFYPFVCSKLNKFISYSGSSFGDDATKQSTGRVVIQKQLNLVNSLTFQISFFGWIDGIKKSKHHFRTSDLEEIGMSLALGVYYTQISIKKLQQTQDLVSTKSSQRQKAIHKNSQKIYEKWKNQMDKQTKKEEEVLSQGSSIDPEQFQLRKQELQSVQKNNSVFYNSFQQANKNRNKQSEIISEESDPMFSPSISSLGNYQNLRSSRNHYKSLRKPGQMSSRYNLNQNQEEQNFRKSNLFSYCGNEYLLLPSRDFQVKQLQVQLQAKKAPRQLQSLSVKKDAVTQRKNYLTFQQSSRYHDKVKQIKKAFNYCLKNDVEFDFSKSCYKTLNQPLSTNMSSSLSIDFQQSNRFRDRVKKPQKIKLVHFNANKLLDSTQVARICSVKKHPRKLMLEQI